MASLLTVTFGCPGDDSGDTDANTTPGTTTETPGTTTETPGTTTDTPGTTTETPGTTTETPGTTTDTPADSSTSPPGDSDSTTGGGASAECQAFCDAYLGVCGGGSFNDYGDEAGCLDACSGYDAAMLECKAYHASVADGPESEHCGHANIDGGGVC